MNIDEALAAMDAYTFSAGGPTATVYAYAKACRDGERAHLDRVEAGWRDMQRRYELVCHQMDDKIRELDAAKLERRGAMNAFAEAVGERDAAKLMLEEANRTIYRKQQAYTDLQREVREDNLSLSRRTMCAIVLLVSAAILGATAGHYLAVRDIDAAKSAAACHAKGGAMVDERCVKVVE